MTIVMVDIETNGPCPGMYSMIEIGAVVVEPGLKRTFFGRLAPLENFYIETEALKAIGRTNEETLVYPDAKKTIMSFDEWINELDKPEFWADTGGFDWQFINWYFWKYQGKNPFGYNGKDLGSLYKGVRKKLKVKFYNMRTTVHSHNALDDAMGNAEAMLKILGEFST